MKLSNLIISTTLCLLLFTCTTEKNPLLPHVNQGTQHLDSTKVYVKDGISINVNSIKSVYNLDDTLKGNLSLVNENNNNGFDIHIGSYPPPGGYYIIDENGDSLYFSAKMIGAMVLRENLLPGDSLNVNINWNQLISIANNNSSGLKIFSGNYKLQGKFWGNDTLKNKSVIKWFEITEEGDPISIKAHRHYEVQDSFKVSLIIRNRVSTRQIYTVENQNTIEIHYMHYGELMSSQYDVLELEGDKLEFDPKSDQTIYTYSISKQDSSLSKLKGAFDLHFIIRCKERNLETAIGGINIY